MEFIRFIFSNIFIFVGFVIGFVLIIISISQMLYKFVNRILRHRAIMKHGWPPAHINADGEAKGKCSDCDEEKELLQENETK